MPLLAKKERAKPPRRWAVAVGRAGRYPGLMSAELRQLVEAIAASDRAAVDALLASNPGLARDNLPAGATRADPATHFIAPLECYAYAGDTALHLAAAAYQTETIRQLIDRGAD